MNTTLYYLLQVSLCYAIFYGVYKLLFSNDTFFIRNRYYLIIAMVISLFCPMLHFKIYEAVPYTANAIQVYSLPSLPVTTPIEKPDHWPLINAVILSIYLIGVMVCLFRLILAYYKINQFIRNSEKRRLGRLILAISTLNLAPFSFFRWLVISKNQLEHPSFKNIVQHESIHSRQYHSVDLLLAELLVAFQWYNPFAWWLKKSMVENHEFIVDQSILHNNEDPQQYQYSLLTFFSGESQLAAVNYYNSNLLKKRIHMMNKMESPKWYRLKNLAIVLSLSGVIAFTATFEKVAVAQEQPSASGQNQIAAKEDVQELIANTSTKTPTAMLSSINSDKPISNLTDLKMFLIGNIRYPLEAINKGWSGILVSNITIDNTGNFKKLSINETPLKSQLNDGILVVGYSQILKKTESDANPNDNSILQTKSQVLDQKGEKINPQVFINEIEHCLKNLTKCGPSLSGKTICIPINFFLQKKPNSSESKDTTHLIQTNINNTSTIFLVDKETSIKPVPLYILDGKKITEEEMKKISPSTIASIEILKDKSATILYGEEGKNGVVKIHSKKTDIITEKSVYDQTYIIVQQNASFQDGDVNKFRGTIENYLNTNSPESKEDELIKVIVQFTVDKTGSVGDVAILKSPEPEVNQPIIQAVMSSPQWKPALMDGKTVKQQFVMPIKVSPKLRAMKAQEPKKLILSPNPATTFIEVSIPNGDAQIKYDIYVMDNNGKEMIQDKKYGPSFNLNVSNLKTGIYHMVVNNKGNQYQGSFTITH